MPPNSEGYAPGSETPSDNPLDVIKQVSGAAPDNVLLINEPDAGDTASPLIHPVKKLMNKISEGERNILGHTPSPAPAPDPAPSPSPAPDPDQPLPPGDSSADVPQGPPGTQPLTIQSFGQDYVVHVSTKYDLADPDILAEQRRLHSAEFAIKHSRADGSWEEQSNAIKSATQQAREEEAARWQAVLDKMQRAPVQGSDGATQKTMRNYVSDAALYDQAVEEGDARTVALMEENAVLRYGLTDASRRIESLGTTFEETRERDKSLQQLATLKRLVPSLPGDPTSNIAEFRDLNMQSNSYLAYLGKKNYSLSQLIEPDFPHEHYLAEYQKKHGPTYTPLPRSNTTIPAANNVNNNPNPLPVSGTPLSSTFHEADPLARGRNLESAGQVMRNLGGGDSATTAIGGNDDSKFVEYGFARMKDRRRAMEMQQADPTIEQDYLKWYRGIEERSVDSPLRGGGLRVRR